MSRGQARALKQATPEGARRLATVPLHTYAPLFRAQFDRRGPWWWSRRSALGAGGRTDLTAPDGTVCFATTPTGALIEKLWDPGLADPDDPDPQPVTRETLRSIRVWQSSERPPEDPVADLTDPRKGLPKEFCTAGYEVTQRWADAVRAEGASGLVHWLRLDPADGRGVGLFATGPDDGAHGFEQEAFPLVSGPRGDAFATQLPESLFAVVDVPPDEQVRRGTLEDVPWP